MVVDFVESVVQFSVDGGQLFEVSVGLMDGQQDLVHFVYGLIHGRLWLQHNGESVPGCAYRLYSITTLPGPC